MEVQRSLNEAGWIFVWDRTVNMAETLSGSRPFVWKRAVYASVLPLLDCVDLWGSSIRITPTTEPHQLTAQQCSVRGCMEAPCTGAVVERTEQLLPNRGKRQRLSLPIWAFFFFFFVQECEGLSWYSCCVSVQKRADKLSMNYLVIYLAYS